MNTITMEDVVKMRDDWFNLMPSAAVSLDCITETQPTSVAINKSIKRNMKKKGHNMCYDCMELGMDTRPSLEQQRLDHLQSRLSDTHQKKNSELYKAYGLRDDEAPDTLEEFVQRITDQKYVISEEKLKKPMYMGDMVRYIRWRDPSVKEDRPGYNKAAETLRKEFDATLDVIMVSDAKAGLEALQAFEAKQFN